MRIVALGGAGGMGRRALRAASVFDFVDELVVADRDEAAAARVAEQCGARARAIGCDVAEPGALAPLLEAADVVLNAVGPFYRFAVPILQAAIATGTHYLDINDDWEPTLEMLTLDAEARAAGVTAVVGIGASPGVSNLLAVKAAAQLDEVAQLVTGWRVGGGSEIAELAATEPSAAIVHWMHQISGTIRVLRGGKLVDVKPVEKLIIDYPGAGRAPTWTVGHPEAVTLPRHYPGLRDCVNVMALPDGLAEVLRRVGAEIDAGRASEEEAARALLQRPATGTAAPASNAQPLPPLFALARGRRAGRACSVGAHVLGAPSGGMAGATGVPLAIALELLGRGALTRRGVLAPEAALDPDTFFDLLAPRCDPPLASREDLLSVRLAA